MTAVISYRRYSGVIRNLRQKRLLASFVLTEKDRNWGMLGAVAAAAAGSGGPAMMTDSHMADTDEEADFLEFSLDEETFTGWVWRSPFVEGDVVDVVATRAEGACNFIAISRPGDQIIALFPHCSRGSRCHFFNAIKYWIWISGFFAMSLGLMAFFTLSGEDLIDFIPAFLIASSSCTAFWAVGIAYLTRKWMPFVRKAEIAFSTLGWLNPSRIDLVKLAKENRRTNDYLGYGVFYFRYNSSVYVAPQVSI